MRQPGSQAPARPKIEEERKMSFFKPYELLYYEKENKRATRCVESFQRKTELLNRMAELKATGKNYIFPFWDNAE